jgi:hypothetical protein
VEGQVSEDWAETRAREWLETVELDDEADIASLAALLREVAVCGTERRVALHQALRVVKEIDKKHDAADSWCFVRDEILSRLEKL